jgi:glycosyltransferase involved in cell wall biosynthesis/predicted O-methyltransferase YrrM
MNDELPAEYWEACRLAQQGDYDEARRLYGELEADAKADKRLASLIRNDLAVLAALEGRIDEAHQGWLATLESDQDCLPARLNRDFLNAELALAQAPLSAGPLVLAPAPGADVARHPPLDTRHPIKVAIVSFLFNWPSTGGGNVHTFELAGFLIKAGYEVRHIYARFPAWRIGQVEGELPYAAEALEFEEGEWNPGRIRERFREAVQAFNPDQVIITDSWNIKPLLAEAVRGYPYILRLQAMECLCPLNNLRLLVEEGGRFRQCPLHQLASPADCCRCLMQRGRMSGALHQAERELCGVGTPEYHEALLRAFGEAEAVLVVNPLTEAMLSPYAQCVRVVTAGIDPERFPWPAPPEPREPWAEGRSVLLFAGLVDERMKGFHVLHEACRRLWQKRRDFTLVATADPPGAGDEFTHYAGWQSQRDLPRLFRAADILVFPTIAQEALGRTAVEAMAAGLPVVASRIGGLPFTVADGATGLLCEPGDPDDLARKLEMLLDDPELRARMGQAGRRRFEEHYAWPVIVDRHYRPILVRRDRGRAPSTRAEASIGRSNGRNGPGLAAPASVQPPHLDSPLPNANTGEELDPLLQLPRALLRDDDHPEPIELPPGLAGLARSSSPQYTLYRLVRYTWPRAILEIGTQAGASAVACALAMRDNGTPVDVACVDPFLESGDNDGLATLRQWYEYVRGSGFPGRGVQLMMTDSRQAVALLAKRFDLVLVDGSHKYDDVRHDFEWALSLLSPDGLVWLHDYVHYEPVRRAVDEVVAERGLAHAVNDVQRNARGDRCGWCVVGKTPRSPRRPPRARSSRWGDHNPMPRLSLIVTALDSHEMVRRQLLHLERIITADCELILVDDGSDPPLEGVCAEVCPGFDLTVHATHDLRPWTQPKARNAGAALARADWLLFFDIDHILTAELIQTCLAFTGDKLHWTRWPAVLDADGQIVTEREVLIEHGMTEDGPSVHANSFLIRTTLFELMCGYDERFCGRYGGDDIDFNARYDRLRATGLARPAEVKGEGYYYPDPGRDVEGMFHHLARQR